MAGILDNPIGNVPVLQMNPLANTGGILGQGSIGMANVGGHNLPLNANGTVTLLHGTSAEGANGILRSSKINSAGEPSVYFSTHPANETGYGTHTVAVDLEPGSLRIDDEFPNGRADFAIDGPSVTVKNPRLWPNDSPPAR